MPAEATFRWCSKPGCRREALADDTLCARHRAGRVRSTAATRPMRIPGAFVAASALEQAQERIATLEQAVNLVLALHERWPMLDPMAERQLRDALLPTPTTQEAN